MWMPGQLTVVTRTGEPVGRIRIRERQAKLLWKLLWAHYGTVLHDRWVAKQTTDASLAEYQRTLALNDSIKAELVRLAEEMGWELPHEQSVGSDPEGTGPVDAAAEREPVDRRT